MTDLMILEEMVGEDGKVVLELPPGKHVRIIVEDLTGALGEYGTETEVSDAEFETLINDPATFKGLGLTAEQIAQSSEIGIWKNREEMQDPMDWVAQMRRKSRESRQHFD